jgi:predicted permease
MPDMTVLLQIGALFLLMTVGFVLGKLKVINQAATKGMSSLIIKAALPALIVMSLQRPFTRELFGSALETLLIAFLFYGAIIAISIGAVKVLRVPGKKAGILAFSLSFSNCGFIGFPVVTSILGNEALFLTSISNIPFNLLAFSAGILIVESVGKAMLARETKLASPDGLTPRQKPIKPVKRAFIDSIRAIPFKHLANANVLAAIIGFSLFWASIVIPRWIALPLEMLGSITTPLAMIVTGAMLSRTPIRTVAGDWRIYVATALRLLLWPAITAVVLWFAGIRGELFYITVIIAGMPAASNTSLIAEVYGGDTETASAIVFMSTLFSVVTIPLLAYILATIR